VCIEPFVSRLIAFKQLAESGAAEFGKGGPGRLASLAIEPWENAYAKICWTFVREQCVDDIACNLNAREDGNFLKLIRAFAEYASGKYTNESGFGGAARHAIAWGQNIVRLKLMEDKFFAEHEPKADGIQ
jgi:hypothetical protein